MIYSAKIRRMSRRRQKIAVRRRMRELLRTRLRSGLSPFAGQPYNRETLARMCEAMAATLGELHHAAVISSARLHDDVLHMRVYLSPPKPAPAIRTPVFFSTL